MDILSCNLNLLDKIDILEIVKVEKLIQFFFGREKMGVENGS